MCGKLTCTGFMKDRGRCNVAMTRAKEVFWVLGGPLGLKHPWFAHEPLSPFPKFEERDGETRSCSSLLPVTMRWYRARENVVVTYGLREVTGGDENARRGTSKGHNPIDRRTNRKAIE